MKRGRAWFALACGALVAWGSSVERARDAVPRASVAATADSGSSDPPVPAAPLWGNAAAGYPWSFPRDHWAHPEYRTEWWYLTGHLVVADSAGGGPAGHVPAAPAGRAPRRFGYQLTFFRIALSPTVPPWDSDWASRGLILAHAAITDLESGTHHFTDVVHREIPLLGGFPASGDSLLAWCRAPAGTDAVWSLAWNGRGFDLRMEDEAEGIGFALRTKAEKPRVFQGPGGLSRKGEGTGAASLYYSFTRLATEGTLHTGADTFPVRGTSWMDKEFGSSQLGADQVGWDWFSLSFEDGRELMIYSLRRRDGTIDFTHGSLVGVDGATTFLAAGAWDLKTTGSWTSPRTGARYPAGWDLQVPGAGVRVHIRPLLDDQENVPRRSGSPPYWEGGVELFGDDGGYRGRGYVELTGYAPGGRPPI